MKKKNNPIVFLLILSCFLLFSCGKPIASPGEVSSFGEESVSEATAKGQEDGAAQGKESKNENESFVESYTKYTDYEPVKAELAADENKLENKEEKGEQTEMKMNVQIGEYRFTATLEKNRAVEELLDMMKEGPVTMQMDDYSGFEKVGPLGKSLTTSNSQTTTTAGDIVLYNGNNIVMFYGSNSWSYTRIGKIDDLADWEKALGSGSITAVFTLAE